MSRITWILIVAMSMAISAAGQTETTGSTSPASAQDGWRFAVWLGVLGWSLQGLFDFGLYIPALAWPAFTLLGWLLGLEQPGLRAKAQTSMG